MRKKISTILILLASIAITAQPQSLIVGAGTSMAAGNGGPLYRTGNSNSASGGFIYSRHYAFYPATVLCNLPTGATITKIGWYKNAAGSVTGITHSFKVYVKNTTVLSSTVDAWSDLINGAVLAYDNPAMQIPQAAGWWELSLQTPFVYTGGNIEVYTDWYSGGSRTTDNPRTTGAVQFQFTNANNFWCGGRARSIPFDDWDYIDGNRYLDILNIKLDYSGGTPKVEICNGIDDDCDGLIDEGFIEVCDLVDNDCDGQIDEGFDKDGDGYTSCNGDCNDNDQGIHPGAVEICNGKDDDCDGLIDEGFDKDGDGYTSCGGDCNDNDKSINPKAPEVAGNDVDENCDGKFGKVELYGLEVIQTIQDWKNSIPLIEGKKTIVRVHIKSREGKDIRAKFKLNVYDENGVKLSNPPLKPKPGLNRAPFTAYNTQDDLDIETELRSDLVSSLNFCLEPKWTKAGQITLELEGKGLTCGEIAGIPNDCKYTATFLPGKQIEVKLFSTSWTDGLQNYDLSETDFELKAKEIQKSIKEIFPLSNVVFTKDVLEVTYKNCPSVAPDLCLAYSINEELNRKWLETEPAGTKKFYVAIAEPHPHANENGHVSGEASGIPSQVCTIFNLKGIELASAHELAHCFGRTHVEFCGAKRDKDDEDQKFPFENIFEDPDHLHWIPAIGPQPDTPDPQTKIFGYSAFSRRNVSVRSDRKNFELMAYCNPGTWWISDHTYKALVKSIPASAKIAYKINQQEVNTANQPVLNNPEEYLLINGNVDLNTNAVQFSPAMYMYRTTSPHRPESGPYKLQMLDQNNAVLETIDFNVSINGTGDDTINRSGTFFLPVLLNTVAKKAILLKNDTVLSEITASNHVPQVQVLHPNGGEALNRNNSTIIWTGSDDDGDSLTYGVAISRDGGGTWNTLATSLKKKTYKLRTDYIGASDSALVRVFVSDGFNVAKDESDSTFALPNSPPDGYILLPANNTTMFEDGETAFEAVARDIEDSALAGSAITWTSSLDGFLGTGEYLSYAVAQLQDGQHTIYLTITDSHGASVVDSTTITVYKEQTLGTTYYTKTTGDLHNTSTWGVEPDGSGANPADFGTGKTFQLANRPEAYTLTSNWTVTGILNIPPGSQLRINGNSLSLATAIGDGTISGSPTSDLNLLPSVFPFALNLTPGSQSMSKFNVGAGANATLLSPVDLYDILTVDGTLNTGPASSALLTFKSTVNKTARLAPVTGFLTNGFVKSELYIPPRRAWRMINSPLSGSISIFDSWQESRTNTLPDPNPFPGYGTHITGGPLFGAVANGFDQNPDAASSLKKYNSVSNAWLPVEQTIAQSPHQPLMLFVRGDRGINLGNSSVPPTPTVLRHTGILNVGNISSAVHATGFTAVANPYQSPVNFATLTRNNVQNNFYVWDPKMGGENGTGAYVLISFNGTNYDVSPSSTSAETQYIQTGQSFMVRTIDQNFEGGLVFKESDKSETPTRDVFRTANSHETKDAPVIAEPRQGQGIRIRLKPANDKDPREVLDEAFASFKNDYLSRVDEFDGLKIDNPGENLGIVSNKQTLMLERRPLPKEKEFLELRLWNLTCQKYVLEFEPTGLDRLDIPVFLEDAYLKTFSSLATAGKSQTGFTVPRDSSAQSNRFRIVFGGRPKVMSDVPKQQITAYPNPADGQIITLSFISKPAGSYEISLANSLGQILLQKNIRHTGGSQLHLLQLQNKPAAGVYQLKIAHQKDVNTIKLIVE